MLNTKSQSLNIPRGNLLIILPGRMFYLFQIELRKVLGKRRLSISWLVGEDWIIGRVLSFSDADEPLASCPALCDGTFPGSVCVAHVQPDEAKCLVCSSFPIWSKRNRMHAGTTGALPLGYTPWFSSWLERKQSNNASLLAFPVLTFDRPRVRNGLILAEFTTHRSFLLCSLWSPLCWYCLFNQRLGFATLLIIRYDWSPHFP